MSYEPILTTINDKILEKVWDPTCAVYLSAFKKAIKEKIHEYVYYDKIGNILTEEDIQDMDPKVLHYDISIGECTKFSIVLDLDSSKMNLASKKINEMNLSPADLKVINEPIDEIYRYFMEIKAIPVEEFKLSLKEMDEYYEKKIENLCIRNSRLTNHELADSVLCEIIKIFGLQKTWEAYKKVMK